MTTERTISASGLGTVPDTEGPEFCLPRVLAVVRQTPLRFILISAVMLIPCIWQPHIAAGDLASHAYNAWIVHLIKQGQAPGLSIAHRSTNVLFDFMLEGLMPLFGTEGAQRLSVGIAVLVFFWSGFGLISAITKKLPWAVTPILAILAYGTVFNMGLFNYYIAGALSFAAIAVLWEPRLLNVIIGIGLFALGWVAQPLPVIWAIAILAYLYLARTLPQGLKLVLPAVCIAILFVARNLILHYWTASWNWRQALHATGADQAYMFGSHYRLTSVGLVAVWAIALLHFARERGLRNLLRSIPFQLYAISVLGCFLLPDTILFPWYKAAFGGVAERVAWLSAIFVCVLVSETKHAARYGCAAAVVALLFFALLYSDARGINRMENRVDALVSELPPNSRVIAELRYPPDSGFDESMLLDRACIGKCFSFGNYEPATDQFRVHATPGNSLVAWSTDSSSARNRVIDRAEQFFSVEPAGTLYFLHACGTADVCMQALARSDLDSLRR